MTELAQTTHKPPDQGQSAVRVRLPTVGRRAFSVAGARTWNDLPADVTSAPSLLTFRKLSKTASLPTFLPWLSPNLTSHSVWSLW